MKRTYKITIALALTFLILISGLATAFASDISDTVFFPDRNDANFTAFGLKDKTSFKSIEFLGVQANKNNINSARFVSVALSETLKNSEDYGYIFNVVDNIDNIDEIKNNAEAYTGSKSTVISCKGTQNSIAFGKYGNDIFETTYSGYTRYKYITALVKNIPDDKIIIARFYIQNSGNIYYADYKSGGSCCVINIDDLKANIKSNIEIIAHRGAEDSACENTLAAFDIAGKQGCYDGVETDYWITKSNDILIYHDPKINGTSIKNLSVSNRKNYPLPFKYKTKELEAEYGQQYIPTIEEAIATISKYDLKLYLHTKDDTTSQENLEKITALLDKYNMREKTVIYSKDMNCCKRIMKCGVKAGYIISEPSYLTMETAVNLCIQNKVYSFIINYIYGFPTDRNIKMLHDNNIKVGIYSDAKYNVNGSLEATLELIDRGIDTTIVNNRI